MSSRRVMPFKPSIKTHLLNGSKIMWLKPNLVFRVDRSTDTWVLKLHRNWKNSSSRSTSIWPKWWNVIISNGYTDKMQMLNHKMYTMQHNCKQCFIYLYPAHSYNKQITFISKRLDHFILIIIVFISLVCFVLGCVLSCYLKSKLSNCDHLAVPIIYRL